MDKKEMGLTSSHTPSNAKNNTEAKVQKNPDTHKDMTVVLDYFRCISGTSLDCSLSTGILRNSVTFHIDTLQKLGLIQVVKIAPDKHTGYKAKYYSADPARWQKPKFVQLSLFEREG